MWYIGMLSVSLLSVSMLNISISSDDVWIGCMLNDSVAC